MGGQQFALLDEGRIGVEGADGVERDGIAGTGLRAVCCDSWLVLVRLGSVVEFGVNDGKDAL